MARRRKVPIIEGEKRLVGTNATLSIDQTLYCGECNRRLKSSNTQKPHNVVSRICDNIEDHTTGKIYLWVLKGVEMVGTSN